MGETRNLNKKGLEFLDRKYPPDFPIKASDRQKIRVCVELLVRRLLLVRTAVSLFVKSD